MSTRPQSPDSSVPVVPDLSSPPRDAAEWIGLLSSPDVRASGIPWQAFDALNEADRREVATALRGELMALVRKSPPQALPLGESLVRAVRDLESMTALAQRGRAVALHANGRSEEATLSYQCALEWYETHGDELEAARVRRSLVDVLQMAGHSELALEHAERAREVLHRLGQWSLLAQLECNVGNVYFRLDRYGSARPHYERAQELFEQEGDDFGRAHALYNLGNIHTNAHSFDKARECFTVAREAFQEVGHGVLCADCDYALAYLDIRRGRFADARHGLLRAREGYGPEGKPSGQPLCDMDLCELHIRVDAHYDAVSYGRRAIESFDRLSMRYEAAKTRMLLGMALIGLRKEKEGAEHLRTAAQGFAAIGNRTLGALATLHGAPLAKDPLGARSILPGVELAAAFLHESGDKHLGHLAQLSVADVLWRAGEVDKARAALLKVASEQDAVDYEQLGLPNARIEALRSLAALELKNGAPADAKKHLTAAVSWIDATLLHLTSSDARLSFFSRRQPAFAELASLLLEEREAEAAEEAVLLVERSRSRNMAQRVMEAQAPEELRAAREHVDHLLREHWDSVLGEQHRAPWSARGASLPQEQSVMQAQERLLELNRQTRATAIWDPMGGPDAPGSRPGLRSGAVPSVGGLASQDRVLYYLTARGQTYGVLLSSRDGSPEVLQVVCLGPIEATIRRQLSRARYYVEKRDLGSRFSERQAKAARAGLLSCLTSMGELLLAPLAQGGALGTPAGAGLVVVPYGLLHSVPFSALMWHGAPLVCSHDVSVARSLDPLRAENSHNLPGRGVLSCRGAAGDLPAIETELATIGQAAGDGHRVLDARRFLSALGGPIPEGVLHIAAHGTYEPDHPLFAGLRLGDRFLAAFDVARLRLPPCLVVLSGCETGRQSVPHGEDLYGIEQAFMTAGAAGVLGSLWPLSDEGGAELVSGFVQRLLGGATAREALSQVQRQAWESDRPLEDWASLVFAGTPYLQVPSSANPCN